MEVTPQVSCVCRACGCSFMCERRLFNRGQGKFCSRLCSSQHGALARREQAAKLRASGDLQRDAFVRLEGRIEPDLNSGCWLWSGSANHQGYGLISVANQMRSTHRFAYEVANGSIPTGMMVCHRCDTPACVKPAHLFLGTAQNNTDDRMAKGRHNPARGERAGFSVLTEDQVRESRLLKLTPAEMSDRYGIVQSGATRALRGDTWAHIDAPTVDNQKRSKNGVTGLVFAAGRKRPWRAYYYVNRRPRLIGSFSERSAAISAIFEARKAAGLPPPVVKEGDPYRAQENTARERGRGIWQ